MTREEYIDFANALKNNYTIDFNKLPEFCDMAISALSAEGEYIKKTDIFNELGDVNMDILTDEVKEIVNGLQTYTFPDSAENTGEWIPCSERLPEKAGEYLVTYGSNLDGYRRVSIKMYSPNLHNVDEFDFPNKKRPGWYDYDSEYGHYEWNDVIAWMLLPEPYKADMRGE